MSQEAKKVNRAAAEISEDNLDEVIGGLNIGKADFDKKKNDIDKEKVKETVKDVISVSEKIIRILK